MLLESVIGRNLIQLLCTWRESPLFSVQSLQFRAVTSEVIVNEEYFKKIKIDISEYTEQSGYVACSSVIYHRENT